jgi:hypothetical protein
MDDGVLSTHAVSHQLRSLLSSLLMPWQPAVPTKVIYIEDKKNWTIATVLVAIFDDWQYLLDLMTGDDADAEIESYIPRAERTDAFYDWTYDQFDSYYNWAYDQLDAFNNRTYDQLDAFGNWTYDQLDTYRHTLYDQYRAARHWLHDNKIVAEPQWWNNQLRSVLHWFWRCFIHRYIDNVIGRVVVFRSPLDRAYGIVPMLTSMPILPPW